MQIVRDLAGYSLGRADLVRRAMGKKKLDVMAKERENFVHGKLDDDGNIEVPGCIRNGIDEKSANKIFDEMSEFAKYAFNKSHAACYAVVAYQTAYLKAYYPAEFMAAMLNSFIGNLDKVPVYISECKRLNIPILKPDINKSSTKFTVEDNKIRFGMGSIKNVGLNPISNIVKERDEHGEYKDFTDFCERIYGEQVNKKCIESLIKAGAFDSLGKNRATLLDSFEEIIDTIASEKNKGFTNQITMFEIANSEEDIQELKYTYNESKEFSDKELLTMEKEMLGIYISGHPLEKFREKIEKSTNLNAMQIGEAKSDLESKGECNLKDNSTIRIAGIITGIKKKFTKNNKLMAFVTVEDLYGIFEMIVFESTYNNFSNLIFEESIIFIEGRLSIREDRQDVTIIPAKIVDLNEIQDDGVRVISSNEIEFRLPKKLVLDITELNEESKARLRGAIRFFTGDRSNLPVYVKQGDKLSSCGTIFANKDTIKEFEEIVGEKNIVKN